MTLLFAILGILAVVTIGVRIMFYLDRKQAERVRQLTGTES